MTQQEKLYLLLSCVDLTSLEATDNEKTIAALAEKAVIGYNGTTAACVCVYSRFAEFLSKELPLPVKTAVVGGYFPSGQAPLQVKIEELKLINQSACSEVDVVINRGELLNGNYDFVKTELMAMRNTVPTKTLKVILETGELKTAGHIAKASEIAMDAGADFIKTSTGKIAAGANIEAVTTMCQAIRLHEKKTGKKTGIKPSGGIREIHEALTYLDLVQKNLGDDWLQPARFRIGASALYDKLIDELANTANE